VMVRVPRFASVLSHSRSSMAYAPHVYSAHTKQNLAVSLLTCLVGLCLL
jgi:hypothetical protein